MNYSVCAMGTEGRKFTREPDFGFTLTMWLWLSVSVFSVSDLFFGHLFLFQAPMFI